MKKVTIVALLLLIAGCVQSPKAQLKNEIITFTAVGNSLHVLKEAGKFNADEIIQIKAFIMTGNKLLDRRVEAITAGKEPPDVIEALNIIIEELIKFQLKGQSDG